MPRLMQNKFGTEVQLFKEYLKAKTKIGYYKIMQSPLHVNNTIILLVLFIVKVKKNTLLIQVCNVCPKCLFPICMLCYKPRL